MLFNVFETRSTIMAHSFWQCAGVVVKIFEMCFDEGWRAIKTETEGGEETSFFLSHTRYPYLFSPSIFLILFSLLQSLS